MEAVLASNIPNRRGRPKNCLIHALQKAVTRLLNKNLRTTEDLNELRRIAKDKSNWIDACMHSIDLETFF